MWVSLFGNAGLREGLSSSNEEVTIDHRRCKSSCSCMNCVRLLIDVGGGSSETGNNLESFTVCCLAHSNKCSLYQQAVSYGLVNLGMRCLNWVSWMCFRGWIKQSCLVWDELDLGNSRRCRVLQPVGLVKPEQFLLKSLWWRWHDTENADVSSCWWRGCLGPMSLQKWLFNWILCPTVAQWPMACTFFKQVSWALGAIES